MGPRRPPEALTDCAAPLPAPELTARALHAARLTAELLRAAPCDAAALQAHGRALLRLGRIAAGRGALRGAAAMRCAESASVLAAEEAVEAQRALAERAMRAQARTARRARRPC